MTIGEIASQVCEERNVLFLEMIGYRHTHHVSHARHEVMLRSFLDGHSKADIGRYFRTSGANVSRNVLLAGKRFM